MKKKFTFLFSLLLSLTMANAENYSYLTFQSLDGSKISIGVESLTMTFSDGKLLVSNGTESQELPLEQLGCMFFSNENVNTGISEVSAEKKSELVQVYTLSGGSLGTFSNLQQWYKTAKVGVYVVNNNGKIQKIAVK